MTSCEQASGSSSQRKWPALSIITTSALRDLATESLRADRRRVLLVLAPDHQGGSLQGSHGAWSIGNPGLSSGKYYARAGKKPGCKADASKTIQI
jgi:hypothetical protein